MGAVFESFNRAPGLAAASPAAGSEPGGLSLVDRVFGLLLSEAVRCGEAGCGKTTHVVARHVEHFLVVQPTGLSNAAATFEGEGERRGGRGPSWRADTGGLSGVGW
jgi:hypothetical protein